MKRVVILSGKGGTGKSTVSSSVAYLISNHLSIVCADCDVDTPNLYLVLGFEKQSSEPVSTQEVAEAIDIGESKVDCTSICPYGAIEKSDKGYKVDPMMCEGCGACVYKCPKGMFHLKKTVNGTLFVGRSRYGFPLVYSQLKVGKSGSGEIVSLVKDKASTFDADLVLIDSAAGVGCPVIASVKDADLGIVVAEPTLSSFSDMVRSIELLNFFNVKIGVVINRYDMNLELSNKITKFCESRNIPIVAKIPFDKRVVNSLMRLRPVVELYNDMVPLFKKVSNYILTELFGDQYRD